VTVVNFVIRRRLGEFTLDAKLSSERSPLVIMGPSGAGKTLLLRCISGILRPDEGRIVARDHTLFDSGLGIDVPPQDRRVGYVPQDYALFPHLTVAANISYGLRGAGAQKRRRVDEMLDLTGLGDQRKSRPRELSGGQRQRVAVARALAVRPELLLLDEPFAALDVPTREDLADQVRELIAATGTPTIIVTHDRNEALRLADEVAVLMNGRVRQSGSAGEVLGGPRDEEVANFVGVETVVRGRVRSVEDGVAVVEVGDRVVQGGTGVEAAGEVLVCIRADDVVLSTGAVEQGSARNHLAGHVSAIAQSGPYRRVQVDAGFPLVALITKSALDDLGLGHGSNVVASFKATAVHLIPLD